jgi:hypothetical protein
MARQRILPTVKFASGLVALSVLGSLDAARADTPAIAPAETLALPADPFTPAVAPIHAAEADLSFAAIPLSSTPTALLAEVTTTAAGLGDLPSVVQTDPATSGSAQPQAIAQYAPITPYLEVTPPPPVSPWRVELRPYLEVPFDINGRLLFQSFVDLGDLEIELGGRSIQDVEFTPDLSPRGRAALAAAARNRQLTRASVSTGASGGSVATSLDLSDVFLLGGELEVWYNSFGLYIDAFYADLGSQVLSGSVTLPISGVNRREPIQLGANYTRIGAMLGWRAGRFPLTNPKGLPPEQVFPAMTLDLFGGARYSAYGFQATFPALQITDSLNPSWVEPTVMTRAEFLFNQRTKLVTNVYAGGFGVGNAPNFSWGGYAGLDWRFFPNVSIRPSYQFASTDWDGELGSITLQTQSVWLGFSVYFE